MLKSVLQSARGRAPRVAESVFDWVESRPLWLQSALHGAFFVYLLVLIGSSFRVGLIVAAPLMAVLLFIEPSFTLRVLAAALILAPAGGFIGGLIYGISGILERTLGAFGRWLRYVLGTWGYTATLAFVIYPFVAPKDPMPLSAIENGILSGILALVFGSVFVAE